MSTEWHHKLIALVQECKFENNDQRFGQLLFNLLLAHDFANSDKDDYIEYLTHFQGRLFNLKDHELVTIIKGHVKE